MSDPTAMEADKTKEEMTMATIIKQTKEEINWAEIARAREMGVLDKLLAERDVIRFHLRSSTEVAIMVEKVEPGRAGPGWDLWTAWPSGLCITGWSVLCPGKRATPGNGATPIWSRISRRIWCPSSPPAPSARPSKARSW